MISEKRANAGSKGGKRTQYKDDFALAKDQANSEDEYESENAVDINTKITFDVFWNLYDKKVGAKKNCEKKWIKLKLIDQEKIISILPEWLTQFSDKQFQPFPQTFLNQERWNDEIIKDYAKTEQNITPAEKQVAANTKDLEFRIKESTRKRQESNPN